MNQEWPSELPVKKVTTWHSVAGGDVNQAFYLKDIMGRCFFLLVQPNQPADFYQGEIAGLKDFQRNGITAPRVITNGQINGDAYLLLNYLQFAGAGNQCLLGDLVAKLHQVPSPNKKFGYTEPYAGTSISFPNTWTADWSSLFLNQRLDRLADQLVKKGLWSKRQFEFYQRVRQKIVIALKHHQSQPVLLHGDFWAGNFAFLQDGQPVLIDPAALYGDREFDIGITTVFGGFAPDFYQAYQQKLPLEAGYQQRLEFYRLYYLMVHLDKFGMSYAGSVSRLMQLILENN